MSAAGLLAEAERAGVKLGVKGNNVVALNDTADLATPELRERIAAEKPALLALLREDPHPDPSVANRDDASDWLQAGGAAEEMERLAAATPVVSAETPLAPRTEDVWPEIGPLPEAAEPVPTLPDSLLPEPLRGWLADVAERVCVPLDFAAAPALVALGGVVGRSVAIRPSRYDDFLATPNLWGAVVGRPGFMKTALVKEALRPVALLAARAREAHEADSAKHDARRERIAAQIQAVKADMVKDARDGGANLPSLETDLTALNVELATAATTERRFMTQDATAEKLGELLRQNPRGLILSRDELSGWLRTLDKPGREGEREFFLEAWNGTGDYTFDRIGRGTVHVPNMTLAVVGGIQPGKLRHMIEDAMGDGGGADGLLQRLQVLVWPDALGEWKAVERWPNREARDAACKVFETLANAKAEDLGAERDGDDIPHLRFDDAAQELFDAWRADLEKRLRGGELEPTPAFESHLAKFRSLMPSIALLLHLVDMATGRTEGDVSLGAARLAAEWCDFLEAHARKVYATELRPGAEAARAMAARIKAGDVADRCKVRDIYRHHWTALDTAEKVDRAAAALGEAGWVRVERQETGGAPTETLRLHPSLRREGGR